MGAIDCECFMLVYKSMPGNKKHYLTKDGLRRVERELKGLKNSRLSKIKGDAPRSLRFGSVDPEYLVFQDELAQLEKKINEIEEILENYELIKPPSKQDQDRVHLGATVIVEVDGQIDEFMITDSFEANPSLGKISNECPVGKTLLGCKVGETITISGVETVYKIKKISYNHI